ncbi:MAG: GGDEF domain-containing protein [Gemmatimonadetes bacterium]|nr:GGDEF domain-containing protein [Gemmatimonadota bacterium]
MSATGRPFRYRRWAVPAALVVAALSWLAATSFGGLGASDILAAAVAAAAGALIAAPGRVRRWALGPDRRHAGRAEASQTPEDPSAAREREMPVLLRRLAPTVSAARLVVWERDRDEGRLRPLHSSDDLPPSVPAAGDPLAWALDQGQPLRLDRTPVWSTGPTTAAPVPGGLVLTAEGDDTTPAPDAVANAAAIVASFLTVRDREQRSAALAGRFDRFLAFLKALQGGVEAERFPEELASALAEIGDAEGALVAAWADERGRVLASWGTGGGPAPGTYFGVGDGELAMAARAGAPIRRTPEGRSPVLAHAGERWRRVPEHLTVVPLVDASSRTRGVVALWGGARPEDGAVELVVALAPLLALQLQHSTDLVRFRQVAHEDGLTGLRNRIALDERLADERKRFHRYRRSVSLLVLDLDHFKAVNDTYGHAAGDAVLERVAEIVKATIRDADFAARFGGEELVVVLPETMRHEAGEVAERIRAAVASAVVDWSGKRIPVTASIGVSSCPEVVQDPAELLKSADEALYASKAAGRNRVTVALPDTSRA